MRKKKEIGTPETGGVPKELREIDFRFLFERSPEPMLLVRDSSLICWNEAARDALGLAPEERFDEVSHLAVSAPVRHGGQRGTVGEDFDSVSRQGRARFEWLSSAGKERAVEADVVMSDIPAESGRWLLLAVRDMNRAEQERREEEPGGDGYRDTFVNAVSGIFRTTPDGRFLGVNPALATMCGFESPEVMLSTFSRIEDQYVHPDDRKMLKNFLAYPGFIKKFETQLYCRDGSPIWVSLSARAVKDPDGAILYYEGFVEDVTQRKAAEEALRREKATLFTILDNDPVGVILSDREGKYLYVNREFTNLTGYTREDVPRGEDWFNRAFPDKEYRERVLGEWRKNSSSVSGEWIDVEFYIICKDGIKKDIEFRSTFLKDYSITVLKDVTKRKEVEIALQVSEEKYRNIFQNATEGIFQTTAEGRVISANPAFARLFGYGSPAEMAASVSDLGKEIYTDPARRAELRDILEREGHVQNFEVQCHRRDGGGLWISANVRTVHDRSGGLLFYEGTMTDITERKSIQGALEEKSRGLEEANAALKVLLAHREQDGRDLEEKVVSNVKELILPYVERLKESRTQSDLQIVEIIESNLNEVISPFLRHLATRYADFTPREILVADLIKKGKTTKEMSRLLMVSTRTIDIHRYNIRRKLNLNRRRVNLRTFLLSLA